MTVTVPHYSNKHKSNVNIELGSLRVVRNSQNEAQSVQVWDDYASLWRGGSV